MNILYHNRSNYYGINEKIASLPHFLTNIPTLYNTITTAARANQQSPTAGKLWSGTPISDFFVGKAHASTPSGSPQTTSNQLPDNYIGPPAAGQTTNQQYNVNQTPLPTNISTVPSGGGGDSRLTELSKIGDRNPAQQTEYERLLAELQGGQNDINAEIENAYNEQMGFLNNLRGTTQENFGITNQGIEGQYGESRDVLDMNKQSNLRDIDQQVVSGDARKEDAITAARRLYNELIMGGQQRFGGASSAGEAFQALSGRELQRNNQQIQNNYQSFMQQIEGAKTTLNERYTAGLQALEGQKTRALDQARIQFNNALLEIDKLKSQAGVDKANQRLQALQDLRNQTFQVNMAIAEMKAQLDQQRQAGEGEIQSALSQFTQQNQLAQQAGQGFNEGTPTSFSTGLQFNNQPSEYNGNMTAYTGIRNPEDELFQGSIAPRRDDRMFA